MTLRPYASASWVDADVLAFDNPVPVRDQYLQVAPGVTASMRVRDGLLAAEYEPRMRFFSDIPLVNETSHFAGLKLESPVGSRAFLRLGYRYTRAILETTVVDPGREYFFDLSRFTFHEVSALARVDLGARLSAEAEARAATTRFDETQEGGFFDYDNRTFRAGLGYDVGSDLRATVSYAYERIPPSPDRAIVETSAHSLLGTLSGTIAPAHLGLADRGVPPPDEPARLGRERVLPGPRPRRLAAPRARPLLRDRAPAEPRLRAQRLRHERLLRDELDRRDAQRARALGDLGARLGGVAAERLPERRPGDRRAAPRRHPRLDGRPRAGDRLAGLGPRRLPPRAPQLQPARLRRDHGRFRRAARRGPLRPGTFPTMIATLLALALLQTPPPAEPPPRRRRRPPLADRRGTTRSAPATSSR